MRRRPVPWLRVAAILIAAAAAASCEADGGSGDSNAPTGGEAREGESPDGEIDENARDSRTSRDSGSASIDAGIDHAAYRSIVDLVALRTEGNLDELETVEVTVDDDPAYDGTKRLRGWPLETLLERHADLPESRSGWVVQFIATDGYRATVPLDELSADDGVVAFRDLDAPEGATWSTFPHGDGETTPAPFYLVWPSGDGADAHRPWAYKLAKIGVAQTTALWGAAVPDDDSLREGFAVFRKHCIKCHSVNLAGGSVGPELNVPMNVTEYWRLEHLPKYIREPSRYRADAEMPAMESVLSDEEISALVGYLRGMRREKICSSAEECDRRRNER